MAVSPPSEATQPRRWAGFLVSNCEEQKFEFITIKGKIGNKHVEKKSSKMHTRHQNRLKSSFERTVNVLH